MIIGTAYILDGAVNTHRDSYLLPTLSVVSVRRPFIGPAVILALGLAGFSLAFGDLLLPHESIPIGLMVFAILFMGLTIGQLQLLSRDLRGSELSGAIWGTYPHLNHIRAEIVQALVAQRQGDQS